MPNPNNPFVGRTPRTTAQSNSRSSPLPNTGNGTQPLRTSFVQSRPRPGSHNSNNSLDGQALNQPGTSYSPGNHRPSATTTRERRSDNKGGREKSQAPLNDSNQPDQATTDKFTPKPSAGASERRPSEQDVRSRIKEVMSDKQVKHLSEMTGKERARAQKDIDKVVIKNRCGT